MTEKIIVKESGELMVDVKKACPGLTIDLWKKRIKKEKTAYLRKTVADKLNLAKSYLPSNMTFIIGDAWRSQKIQKAILKRFERKFRSEHPEWPAERVKEEVNTYAAPAEGEIVSGHMTGGAVDLRLCWKNGKKAPIKSKKLSYQENANPKQKNLAKNILRNRKIMQRALKKAGLSNNPHEYWHWSYGDYGWAKREGKKKAIYDVISINM